MNAAGNDPPVASNDPESTNEDTPVTIVVLSNDSDIDGDMLTTTGVLSGPSNGVATLNANGTIEYTPHADFNGQDSFVYSISDGKGGMDTATGVYCWTAYRLGGAFSLIPVLTMVLISSSPLQLPLM